MAWSEFLHEERKKRLTRETAHQEAPPAPPGAPKRRDRKKTRARAENTRPASSAPVIHDGEHTHNQPWNLKILHHAAGLLRRSAEWQEQTRVMTPHEAQELRDLAAAIMAQGGEEFVTSAPVDVEHPVAEDEAAAPPAPAEQCPAPVSRFQEMGRARTPVKAERARENGRRGGRPRKWSREVLGMVAAWIRRELEAGTVQVFNEKEELQHLAQALEAGKVR